MVVNWQQLDQQYIMSTYQRFPIAIAHAKGNYLTDTEGNTYLDLFTGLAVNILGHAHPKLKNAIHEQTDQFLHISNYFLNPPAIRLAKRLVELTFKKGKVYFANSGAEATEAVIKLISKWTATKQQEREGIVVVKQGFHGRTLGALRLTRQPHVYQSFPTLSYPVYEVTPNDIHELESVCNQYKPAAVLVEPILGSGGVVTLQSHYLHRIEKLCKEQEMLFCMDEIQTGLGRTGCLFGYQQEQLEPDVILFAKGMGGGLPLGGIIVQEHLVDLFQPGDHGTTFAPSPLSCALGNAVLDVLTTDGQLEAGRVIANYLWDKLRSLQSIDSMGIAGIDGKGMMIGMRMSYQPYQVKQIQRQLLEKGFLVDITQQTIIRLLPPLTLTKEEIDHFIDKFEWLLMKEK